MANTNQIKPDHQLDEEIYQQPKSFYIKILFISFFLFCSVIILFLPIDKLIESSIKSALTSSPRCKINYKQIKISYFLPTISLTNPIIPNGCIGKKKINLSQIKIKIIRPSLFPLGLKVNIQLYNKRDSVKIEAILGYGKQVFRIDEQKLSSTIINLLLSDPYSIQGDFTVRGVIIKEGARDFSASLIARSANFLLNSTTIQGLQLPDLNFKRLSLKLSVKGRKLKLESFSLGTTESPITGSLKGSALLNLIDPSYTRINFDGSIHFSKSFRDSFSILNLLLTGKKEEGGRYFFTLKGTLKNPQPTF